MAKVAQKMIVNGEEVGISGGGVTMEQVNTAINEAITGAIQEEYYGTDSES